MQFDKPPTSVAQQMQLLLDRGLACPDSRRAERFLEAVGYYRLSAYWLPFEEPPPPGKTRSKKFRTGVTFEDVLAIYLFDRRLRLLVMEGIDRIEIHVRSRWTNRFSLEYGPHAHLDPNLFTSGWDHAQRIARLAGAVAQSHETFIRHYREKYAHPYMPPLWAVTETMTLGDLSKWLAATADLKIRAGVASDLGIPTGQLLEGVLQVLSLVRNVCAHHGRLWNRRFVKRIPRIKRFEANFSFEASGDGQLRNEIYNVLVVMLHMLDQQGPGQSYRQRLVRHLCTATALQRDAMGFPRNWRKRPIWTRQ